MAKSEPVRGTHDILPEEARRFRHIVETAQNWAERYGYSEIATPIFEFTEVFQRTLGETSDVVTKEMFSFEDRGGRNISLRPEHTAGIVRAVISNGLASQLPQKLFASGPAFRYERPQKGRRRQFHQFDVEILGVAGPEADIESILLAHDILDALKIRQDTTLLINTLGDTESRTEYRKKLVAYFEEHKADLSEDSKARLERNPLRILDSKDKGDYKIIDGAPQMAESRNAESQEFFDAVLEGLNAANVGGVKVDERLVRGLDYYTHTAFEFISPSLGAQGTVVAGGRFDGLMELMGGPRAPGIGWAAGIERLSMLIGAPAPGPPPITLVPVGEEAEKNSQSIAHELRKEGFTIDLGFSGNLKKRLRRADKIRAAAAVVIGDDELVTGNAAIWDFASGDKMAIALDELAAELKKRYRHGK